MMVGGSRPTVFVSSTIRDFEDLRGSLKFWLQGQGLRVWLSEYNDMEKSPGANAFDACFETIRQADFFVLLIGDSRGSLYSSEDGVSVTQQEYRTAYEGFALHGRPIPILFVRSSVKNILAGWPRGEEGREPPFPDAGFVRDFITEVTKEQETTEAVRGLGPYPLANWLHEFRDFEDVANALTAALSLRVDVSIGRALAAMEVDLEFSLSALVGKHRIRFESGDPMREQLKQLLQPTETPEAVIDRALDRLEMDWPFPHHWHLDSVTREVALDPRGTSPVQLNRQQTTRLSMYCVGIPLPESLWLSSLRDAIHSGLLLRYDPDQRRFMETELSAAAIELLRDSEGYKSRYDMAQPVIEALMGPLAAANSHRRERFELAWQQALVMWGLHHAEVNVYRRAASLYAYLRGSKDSPSPDSLLPTTPLGDEEEAKIQRERSQRVDIREWAKIPQFWNM